MNNLVEKKINSIFYNMQAELMLDGSLCDKNIAIKNILTKGSASFFDIYLYDEEKSMVIDSLFVRSLYNLNDNKKYNKISTFIEDFMDYQERKLEPVELKNAKGLRYLKILNDDIVILSFIASHHVDLSEIKLRSIENYITSIKSEARVLSDNYLRNYILNLNPSEEGFYLALDNMKTKTPKEAETLFMECVKICSSDGYLDYFERFYLAEIMQTLREYGISLKDGIL